MNMENKTLLFDLETSPNISYTWFGKHEIDVIEFIEEGYILSFAYKWINQKKTYSYSLADFKGNKEKLVKKLHELFNEADFIVAHNAKQFDIKWANRAFIKYELKPPSPYKIIDTLTMARSYFKFNSNRLNDLGQFLGVGSKLETGGFDLWKRCMLGDKKAFKKMCQYNRQDVVLLEKVYLKLRPYMHNHPVISTQNSFICPICGSSHLQSRGFIQLSGGVFRKRRYQCQECGKWCSGEQERVKDKSNNLKCI